MTATDTACVATGLGLAIGGVDGPDDLLAARRDAAGAEAFEPNRLLGGRGLRYKDRATVLGMLVARDAITEAGLLDSPWTESTSVVVSSNYGNLDTVCRVAATIRAESVTGTSPMDLPNASSNVVASSIAIRFGLRGPNLMLCNGGTSGLDAVSWAATMVAAGRTERVVVVGVETGTEPARALAGPLLDGAAAMVLESAGSARRRAVPALATIVGHDRGPDTRTCAAGALGSPGPTVGLLLGDPATARDAVAGAGRVLDLEGAYGPASGALGLLQCVAATTWVRGEGAGDTALALARDTDGVAAVAVAGAA